MDLSCEDGKKIFYQISVIQKFVKILNISCPKPQEIIQYISYCMKTKKKYKQNTFNIFYEFRNVT